jgi:ABC-2 type transport system permease protein
MALIMRFYRAQFAISWAEQFQYRYAMMIWMIGLVLEPLIYLAVWTSVAESSGGAVNGFTAGDFAAYYIVILVVQHLTQLWDMWQFDYLIRQGVMSGRLLRPIHPIHRDAASNLAYKVMMFIVIIPAVIALTIAFRPTFNTPLWSILAFVPSVVLAGILAFVVGWMIALAAFWTTRTFAINQMYFVAMFFFSGQIAPLELLPTSVQTIANLLPFRWFVSFPTEVALGRLSQLQVLQGMAIQLLWITGSAIVLRLLWREGVKRYTAVGG